MVPDFAIALALPFFTRSGPIPPTEDDFAALANATALYLEEALRSQLSDRVDLQSFRYVVESAEYGAGIPEPRFNVRLVYDFFEYIFLSSTRD